MLSGKGVYIMQCNLKIMWPSYTATQAFLHGHLEENPHDFPSAVAEDA
jgi:hypothetical protein